MTETSKVSEAARCMVPPAGWECTRKPGHDGPCAAIPSARDTTLEFIQDWMGSGDHEPDRWHRDFAAAIDARFEAQTRADERTRMGGDAEFQTGVDAWMDACFGEPIKSDQLERADRFCEEALELCQTMPGFSKDRAHALVDYVFNRPQGEINQEVGGVMVTLAALCNTTGVSIVAEAELELARVWTKVEVIRAKQATKPTGSALPVALSRPEAPRMATDAVDGVLRELLRQTANALACCDKNDPMECIADNGMTVWDGMRAEHERLWPQVTAALASPQPERASVGEGLETVAEAVERCARIAGRIDQFAPRNDFNRGRERGREEAAAAIRQHKEPGT